MKKQVLNLRIVVFLIGIFVISCSFSKCESQDKEAYMGCWTDSIEEKTALSKGRIYRPCDFKEFPPSRFRFQMELNSNGNCSYLFLAPNDNHKMLEGKWSFNEENSILTIYDLDGKPIKQWIVLDAEEDQLVLNEF